MRWHERRGAGVCAVDPAAGTGLQHARRTVGAGFAFDNGYVPVKCFQLCWRLSRNP